MVAVLSYRPFPQVMVRCELELINTFVQNRAFSVINEDVIYYN